MLLIKQIIVALVFAFAWLLSANSLAEPNKTLGPTRAGDTLWKIAERNLPNNAISTEQLVYALYAANPSAFQSGNINLLLKGVTLTVPPLEMISRIPTDQAKVQIDSLQAGAKKLLRAKSNTKRFAKQIRRYKRQLKRYRRKSSARRKVYRRLSRAKRNFAISKRKEVHFSKLMREKRLTMNALAGKSKTGMIQITDAEIEKTNKIFKKFVTEEGKQAFTSKVAEQTKPMKKLVVAKETDLKQVSSLKAEEKIGKKPIGQPENKPVMLDAKENTPKGEINKPGQLVSGQQTSVQQVSKKIISKEEIPVHQAPRRKQQPKALSKNNLASAGSVDKSQPPLQQRQQAKRGVPEKKPVSQKANDWFTFIKQNPILVGGALNGLILLFVLFKLFERKDEEEDVYG